MRMKPRRAIIARENRSSEQKHKATKEAKIWTGHFVTFVFFCWSLVRKSLSNLNETLFPAILRYGHE
jgi:hypothetical protein